MLSILASNAAAGSGAASLISLVFMFVLMYFIMIRPQQKEQKRKDAMLSALEYGSSCCYRIQR